MSLESFANDLHQDVLARAGLDSPHEESQLLLEEVFTEHVVGLIADHNEADGVELAYYEARHVGRTPAAKLNAWAISGDGATADLFVTLYHGTGRVQEVGIPEARKCFQLLRGFLRRALEGFYSQMEESSSAFQVMRQLYETGNALATVRLFLLTDGLVKFLDRNQIEKSLGLEPEKFPWVEKIEPIVWDLEKLSRLRVGHREVIELDFANDYGGPIECLRTADPTGEYQTFLAFLPGPLLARIYGEYGQRLLERNVRAFLQGKGKINKGLQQTLKHQPHRFLAYNNGLCCTAAEARVRDGKLEWIKDFQIVNGGQTTASIFHALKKEKVNVDQVQVQMKLTVLKEQEKVAEIVPLISQYANSQNKVNAADFSANSPFHRTLEQLSRSVWTPPVGGLDRGTHWYYERARGSYADDKAKQPTPAARQAWLRENPLSQKFTKTDMAKFEHSWLGLPHFVCMGAEKNFQRFAIRLAADGEPLVDLKYFKHLVSKALIWRTAEKVFDSLDLPQWRAQSVAYTVAWLVEKSGRRIDLDRIWQEQRLPPGLIEALKVVCSSAHRYLKPLEGNPGEVAKKEACWKEFQDADFDLPDAFFRELSPVAFEQPTSEEDVLANEWEKIRHKFFNDPRTIEALETYTNRELGKRYRRDPVASFAVLDWESLKRKQGLGLKKLRVIVEMFSIAASDMT